MVMVMWRDLVGNRRLRGLIGEQPVVINIGSSIALLYRSRALCINIKGFYLSAYRHHCEVSSRFLNIHGSSGLHGHIQYSIQRAATFNSPFRVTAM